VYTSSNYGKSFVQNTTITSANGFQGMAMSASGQYQTLSSNYTYLYISSDYGQTWNFPTTGSTYGSSAISISASGQYQVMGSFTQIYYSKDYGNNWSIITVSNLGEVYGISISASGQYISATGDNSSNSISCIFTCQNSIANGIVTGTTGTFSNTVTAAAFNSTSDYRVKENIQNLNLNIYNVNPLRPVNYYNNKLNKLDIGFIAHEVQEYYPFLVNGVKDGEETQSLNYNGLIGILVKEIQELKQRVKQLEDDSKNK
jgi:hypothetical protein